MGRGTGADFMLILAKSGTWPSLIASNIKAPGLENLVESMPFSSV